MSIWIYKKTLWELKEEASDGAFQKHVLVQLLIEDSLAGVTLGDADRAAVTSQEAPWKERLIQLRGREA